MISIINKLDNVFNENGELLYRVRDDTDCIVIRPKRGYLNLIPALGS